MRPIPRAAVVARPSVPVLIALRPSSAPKIVAPIDTAAPIFAPDGLRLLHLHRMFGPSDPVLQRRQLRGVLLAHLGERRIAGFTRLGLQANPKIALGFIRGRHQPSRASS